MSSLRSGISECGIDLGENELISGRMNYFIEYGIESCGTPWSPTSQDMAHRRRRSIGKKSYSLIV